MIDSENYLARIIPGFGLAVSLAGLIYGVALWLNKTFSSLREGAALWILGEPGRPMWSDIALPLFDALFAVRTWSRRRVLSVMVATLLLSSLGFFWGNGFVLVGRVYGSGGWYRPVSSDEWSALWTLSLICILPPQLLIFAKTRWILAKLIPMQKAWLVTLAVLGDLVLTSLIYTVWLQVVRVPDAIDRIMSRHFWMMEFFQPLTLAFALMSWMWIIAGFASLSLRVVSVRLSRTARKVSPLLDAKRVLDEPILLLGEVLAGFVFVIACIYAFVSQQVR